MPNFPSAVQAATTTIPVYQINLNNIFGPILVGIFLACGLCGASCVQTLVYFIGDPTDALWVKLLVIVNLLLCGANVVALASVAYTDLIIKFGNITALATPTWGVKAEALLTPLIVFFIQSFFLYRVFKFTKNWLLVVISVSAFTSFGALSSHNGLGSIYNRYSRFGIDDGRPHVRKTLPAWAYHKIEIHSNSFKGPSATNSPVETNVLHANDIFLAVTDLLLAALMAYNLHRSKAISESRIRSTNKVMSTLIVYAIATGALTGAMAMIGFILAVADPSSTANQAIYAILPHMYSNAMLASLNLRQIATKPWRSNNAVELVSGFRANSDRSQGTQVASTLQNSKVLQVSLNESDTRVSDASRVVDK
ncbi:hypothetical protein PAXINDRAFT_101234 [Paxillus involutus ATCC 200175]|uniref:DUF6534 domain-containing protein n=1 Tax=Paxillus involutus ATCC 200175 TaxID=664439 RepID=A0A0C9TYP2_PAXIN|nr:hypothetical protein PAXINDRAFT_101234 [Paxillus involutus ATCC 200175]